MWIDKSIQLLFVLPQFTIHESLVGSSSDFDIQCVIVMSPIKFFFWQRVCVCVGQIDLKEAADD